MKKLLILCVLSLAIGNKATAKTPLTGNDLTYLGAFAVPKTTPVGETPYGIGLALRRVNGEVRLFYTGYSGGRFPLFEMSVPTPKKATPWNIAAVVKTWGDVFSDQTGWVNGLYWDDTDQRLYYSSSGNYVASGDVYAPSIAYLTFNTEETAATSYGRWGLSSRYFKQANTGILGIPSDFSTQYLGGKRLAAGFGGYQSIMAYAPVSMGPALAAIAPPTTEPEGGYLANIPLVGYTLTPWTSGARPSVDRCWRDDDFVNDHQDYSDPDSSYGGSNNSIDILMHKYSGDESFYWQGYSVDGNTRIVYPDQNQTTIATKHWEPGNAFWSYDFVGGGAWVQTANKEGVVMVADLSIGRAIYVGSHLYNAGLEQQWMIYSREQMANVAQGTVAQDQIQPSRYDMDLVTTPKSQDGVTVGTSTTSLNIATTPVTFDTQSNLIYTPGMEVQGICKTNSATVFKGLVTAYSGTTMTVANAAASGTCADWYIMGRIGGGLIPRLTKGVAYDPVDQRLYVASTFSSTPTIGASTVTTIHVFEVNDTAAAPSKTRYRLGSAPIIQNDD